MMYKSQQEINKVIYNNVKAMAERDGLKLGDVERSAGIPVGSLSRKRKGGAINVLDVFRLADVLKCGYTDILNKDTSLEIEKEKMNARIEEVKAKLQELIRERQEMGD